MERLRQAVLVCSADMAPPVLLELLKGHGEIEETRRDTGPVIVYDTFDWRLYRRKTLALGSATDLNLFSFAGELLGSLAAPGGKRLFWWDAPASAARDLLKEMIDVRALLPMNRLHREIRSFRVLNEDQKTVVRLALRNDVPTAATGADLELSTIVVITELRGYQSAYDKLVRHCAEVGLTELDSSRWLADRVYARAARTPLDYGDKFRVDLDCRIGATQAIAAIGLHLLAEMETNRAGVYDDIDTEFLHDFRIAIRRTRSMLGLLKKQIPARQGAHFRKEFKWIGGVTGPLRDTDVYLLEKRVYQDMLPDGLRSGLDGFFLELEQRRLKELKLVRRYLSSRRFANLLNDWREFLGGEDSELFTASLKRPCRRLADRTIRKRFNSFLRGGAAITDTSPDSELHRLRIEGKKLRYLFEFFRSLYDEKILDQFIKQMKKVQDNLGEFNDLSVQEHLLSARLAGLSGKGRATVRQAAALGGLITVLAARRRRLRADFAALSGAFSAAENVALIKQLTQAPCQQAEEPSSA